MKIELGGVPLSQVGTSIAMVGGGKLKIYQNPMKVLDDIALLS